MSLGPETADDVFGSEEEFLEFLDTLSDDPFGDVEREYEPK